MPTGGAYALGNADIRRSRPAGRVPARPSLVGDIVARALAGRREVSATSVYQFAQSPFALWCEAFAPREARDGVDEFLEMLLQQGRDHEARVVAARFPDAVAIPPVSLEADLLRVVELMASGAAAIHGAALAWLPEGLHGRADVLERRDDAPSVFGPYHYAVKEIKLARNLKDEHRLQAAFYHYVLARIQGYAPASFAVVNRDHEESRFAYDEAEVQATLRAIRAIQDGLRPDPVLGAGTWPWESYTDRCAEEARDVSLVGGVGPATREKLAGAGFRTVDALARASPGALRAIRGVGPKRAEAFTRSAEAIVRGTHLAIAPPRLRAARTEVFLDLEGTGAQLAAEGVVEVDYLIGACVRKAGEGPGAYVPFLAPTPDAEGEMWRAFLAWFEAVDDPVLYHWSPYEATHLRRLAQRHGLDPAVHARLFASLVDLLPIARESYAFPTYGNSIKRIAPYAGFTWRHKGVGAMTSIAHYFAYVKDPVAARDRLQLVLDYNEDDCIAMRVVRDWLEANALSAVGPGV